MRIRASLDCMYNIKIFVINWIFTIDFGRVNLGVLLGIGIYRIERTQKSFWVMKIMVST